MTASNFTYAVFGLLLRSNLPIPELIPLQPELIPSSLDASADLAVAVHLNASPQPDALNPPGPEELSYANSYKDEAGESTLKIWKADGLPLSAARLF